MNGSSWLIVASLLLAIAILFYPSLHKKYRSRQCTGKLWKAEFPLDEKQTIRSFLTCLTDSMAFRKRDILKFRPSDKVLDIYKSIYCDRIPYGDCMECETFLENLSETFGKDIESLFEYWHEEITLRDLYSYATR